MNAFADKPTFDIYRQKPPNNILQFMGTVELEVIYCSEAVSAAIREGLITEPGRYFALRLESSHHDKEMQVYDVDYEAMPLKLCRSLQNEIPMPISHER